MASSSTGPRLYSSDGLTRWYIDTRELTASTSSLPLLSTLQPSDQETVQKFYHLRDRHMSLASQLLKYLFIHQTCRVPWDQIIVSRTPAPHHRPCYIPVQKENGSDAVEIPNIEFNVSHQASMVALAGCIMPPGSSSTRANPTASPTPSPTGPNSGPQIGIDITCTDERGRRNKDSVPSTEADLHRFIDIFSDVFSAREIQDMKTPQYNRDQQRHSTDNSLGGKEVDTDDLSRSIDHRLRRFYSYWALKEAYIKMTGEALLAPWLRQLEFDNVVAPEPGNTTNPSSQTSFGDPYRDTKVLLHGQEVRDVRIELVGLGEEYIFATAARGKRVGKNSASDTESELDRTEPDAVGGKEDIDSWVPFRAIDINTDIEPCATGKCNCLSCTD